MKRSIEKLRHEYGNAPFLEETLAANPIEQFLVWFEEAVACEVMEPNGMTLASVGATGHPSSRTVLLKEVDQRGFAFFTNVASRKGEQLMHTSCASLTFWWKEIYRQVNIEGYVKPLSRRAVLEYFRKRPRGAQLAALASHQSIPLASRQEIESAYRVLQKKYRGKAVPCPKEWGGYRLEAERFEFWQGRKNRLHDRFVYVREAGEWLFSRLAP